MSDLPDLSLAPEGSWKTKLHIGVEEGLVLLQGETVSRQCLAAVPGVPSGLEFLCSC